MMADVYVIVGIKPPRELAKMIADIYFYLNVEIQPLRKTRELAKVSPLVYFNVDVYQWPRNG